VRRRARRLLELRGSSRAATIVVSQTIRHAVKRIMGEGTAPDVVRIGELVARSPAMCRVLELLPRLAHSATTVLVEGNTGTGKTEVARTLHRIGPRESGPFVVVDCGAIPASLIESELFGHERGAYTDAHATRRGAFEKAQGGTVFLDEIGELPREMQPKLLRALEDRVVRRLGGTEDVHLDTRFVAATQRDLRAEVARGAFREDLYYRLAVVRLHVPPLAQRLEDLPLLVAKFCRQLTGCETPPPGLMASLDRAAWPGNVRELRNEVERALLLGCPAAETHAEVAMMMMPSSPEIGGTYREHKERAIGEWERRFVDELMRRFAGNLSRAARAAGMDRTHLRRLIARCRRQG
jgi:two-component system response regulator GlrR